MSSRHSTTPLKRPRASFVFYPREFYLETIQLSAKEIGRLFTDICTAVDNRDEAFLSRYSRFIGRVYWRDYKFEQRPPIPTPIRRAVFDRDGRTCVQCGSDYKLEIDHFIPYSKGGQHTFDNLRVLCKPCNRRKGARMPEVN